MFGAIKVFALSTAAVKAVLSSFKSQSCRLSFNCQRCQRSELSLGNYSPPPVRIRKGRPSKTGGEQEMTGVALQNAPKSSLRMRAYQVLLIVFNLSVQYSCRQLERENYFARIIFVLHPSGLLETVTTSGCDLSIKRWPI